MKILWHLESASLALTSKIWSFAVSVFNFVWITVGKSPSFGSKYVGMNRYINESSDVFALLYHLLFPAKSGEWNLRVMLSMCLRRYALGSRSDCRSNNYDIGLDRDYAHFLMKSVQRASVTKTLSMLKWITAKQFYGHCPEVMKKIWWGEYLTYGYDAIAVVKQRSRGNDQQVCNEIWTRVSKLHSALHPGLVWIPCSLEPGNSITSCNNDFYLSWSCVIRTVFIAYLSKS